MQLHGLADALRRCLCSRSEIDAIEQLIDLVRL
jgi:hypothetical protein